MTPPLLTFRVTLPEPAAMLPEPVRLPVARLIAMSPLLVATFDPITRPLVSLSVSARPEPRMLAMTVLTFVLTNAGPLAVRLKTLPLTWPAEVLRVTEPWLALIATLPEPARMLPLPKRLPLARLIEISPLLVAMLVPTSRRALTSLAANDWPAPVIVAITVLTLVLSAVLFWAVTVSTLPVIWPAEVLSVMPPRLALSVTLAEPAMMLPEPVRLPVARLMEMSPLLVATFVPTARSEFCSLIVSF